MLDIIKLLASVDYCHLHKASLAIKMFIVFYKHDGLLLKVHPLLVLITLEKVIVGWIYFQSYQCYKHFTGLRVVKFNMLMLALTSKYQVLK